MCVCVCVCIYYILKFTPGLSMINKYGHSDDPSGRSV